MPYTNAYPIPASDYRTIVLGFRKDSQMWHSNYKATRYTAYSRDDQDGADRMVNEKRWDIKFWTYILNGDADNAKKYSEKLKASEADKLDELMFGDGGPPISLRVASDMVTPAHQQCAGFQDVNSIPARVIRGETEILRVIADDLKSQQQARAGALEVILKPHRNDYQMQLTLHRAYRQ